MNPDNYRGIALACCMSKFLAAVLNQRLLKFALQNNIICDNQLGFMPGNRTSDALIVLYNLVNKYCVKNNRYIYACLISRKRLIVFQGTFFSKNYYHITSQENFIIA